MRTCRNVWAVLCVALASAMGAGALIAPSALAQEAPAETPPTSPAALAVAAGDRNALLARFAELELRLTVDRDFDGVAEELQVIQAMWTQVDSAGRRVVLGLDAEVGGQMQRLLDIIAAARVDDRDELYDTVWDAIDRNDETTLTGLGVRAAAIVRASLEERQPEMRLPSEEDRVFRWLMRLDEAMAFDFLKADPLRLGRASHAVVVREIFTTMQWTVFPGRTPEPEHSGWLDLVASVFESETIMEAYGGERGA